MMHTAIDNIYETVYNIVLRCGNIHNQRDFSIDILHAVATVCPFDQARIYFYNGNGKVCEQHLLGVDQNWANAYHEYYSKILNGRYGLRSDLHESLMSPTQLNASKNWSTMGSDEFINDYIRPQGLKYTLGFAMFDANGNSKAQFMLDRTSTVDYSPEERQILRLAYPQLNNLHKNFFSTSNNMKKLENVDWKITNLTAREIDVTMLLCQGVSPANIGKKLHIAVPTVNKHISHIYNKMQVSSRQELLVRILNY